MIALQGLIMLKGIDFVIMLYLLTGTWLKSSADGSVWRIQINFPKPSTQTSCSALHNYLQRIGAARTAAHTGIPSNPQIYSWLDGAFHSSLWKGETPRAHKVCVKGKLLLTCTFISCVECDVACRALAAVRIVGITGVPLWNNTFPLASAKSCCSVLATSIQPVYPQKLISMIYLLNECKKDSKN